jgi:curli biogenesis system outer membrane secretion channel CsgG
MKKSALLLVLPLLATVFLAGCGNKAQPMTEAEQAAHYGWTLEEYRENKQAAARMNMTIEEHAKMIEEEGEDHMGDMDMDDDMDM